MIVLENITKEYGERTLFRNINFQFPSQERLAIVGPNGRGKTTLLKIITGEEESSAGKVLMPKDMKLGYLPQEPNPNPRPTVLEECIAGAKTIIALRDKMAELIKQMESPDCPVATVENFSALESQFQTMGGYSIDSKAAQILNGLGFSEEQIARSPLSLSGGWRMRLELAKIFLANPDFLLLDEPTNHLDLPSLVWVEKYLMDYRGTLVFVSHDRPLLNRLATQVIEIGPQGLKSFVGNFDSYLLQKELLSAQLQAERDQIMRRQKELETFITRFGAKASKATQAQSRMKMLARLRAEEEGLPEEEVFSSIDIRLKEPPKSGRVALSIKDLTIGYPNVVLAKNINLVLERGMRVAIIGANGIGKSTLLKTIVGKIPPLSGLSEIGERVLWSYFAQDQLDTLDNKKDILSNILENNAAVGEREARSLLGGLLFRGPDVFKKVGVLSGGEKSRVGLARVLLDGANFLILDEPTNHLDMTSVEIMTKALSDYKGTLLFVSHDRTFIDDICTHVFVMLKNGESGLFEGTLDDYQRQCKISGFENVLIPKESKNEMNPVMKQETSKSKPKANEKNVDSAKKKSNLSKLEDQMQDLRVRIEKFDDEIANTHPGDHRKIIEISRERDVLSAELVKLEDQWLEQSSEQA